jgi:hypothetical protein
MADYLLWESVAIRNPENPEEWITTKDLDLIYDYYLGGKNYEKCC